MRGMHMANADNRQHIARPRRRATIRPSHDEALPQRSSLTTWFRTTPPPGGRAADRVRRSIPLFRSGEHDESNVAHHDESNVAHHDESNVAHCVPPAHELR